MKRVIRGRTEVEPQLIALARRTTEVRYFDGTRTFLDSRLVLRAEGQPPILTLEERAAGGQTPSNVDRARISTPTAFYTVGLLRTADGKLELDLRSLEVNTRRTHARAIPRGRIWLEIGRSPQLPLISCGLANLSFGGALIRVPQAAINLDPRECVSVYVEYESEDLTATPGCTTRLHRLVMLGTVLRREKKTIEVALSLESVPPTDGWNSLVSSELYRSSKSRRIWSRDVMPLLEAKFLKKTREDAESSLVLDRRAPQFLALSEELEKRGAGHTIVTYSADGQATATISFACLRSGAFYGHGICARQDVDEVWIPALREAHLHGFALASANAQRNSQLARFGLDWFIAGLCNGERAWLERNFRAFADKYRDHCCAIRTRVYRIFTNTQPHDYPEHIEVVEVPVEEILVHFDALGPAARSDVYRQGFGFTPVHHRLLEEALEDPESIERFLGFRRTAFVARLKSTGQALAFAVVDEARAGVSLLDIFDVTRIFCAAREVPIGDREDAEIALLCRLVERSRAGDPEKSWFHYSREEANLDPPSSNPVFEMRLEACGLGPSKWTGDGFAFILAGSAVAMFTENISQQTADPGGWRIA